jgi:hypothetical protein
MMTDNYQEYLDSLYKKADSGTLTVKDVPVGFYRLREGEHANKVIIKTYLKIDDKSVCIFANAFTWTWTEKINDILCESVQPSFSQCKHEVKHVMWQADNGDGPYHNEW